MLRQHDESLPALQLLLLRHAQGQYILPLLYATLERESATPCLADGRPADLVQCIPVRVGHCPLLQHFQPRRQLAPLGLLLLPRRRFPHESLRRNQCHPRKAT